MGAGVFGQGDNLEQDTERSGGPGCSSGAEKSAEEDAQGGRSWHEHGALLSFSFCRNRVEAQHSREQLLGSDSDRLNARKSRELVEHLGFGKVQAEDRGWDERGRSRRRLHSSSCRQLHLLEG